MKRTGSMASQVGPAGNQNVQARQVLGGQEADKAVENRLRLGQPARPGGAAGQLPAGRIENPEPVAPQGFQIPLDRSTLVHVGCSSMGRSASGR